MGAKKIVYTEDAMKVLIWADIEGASGVNDYHQVSPLLGNEFETCIQYITSDINAAIQGLKRAGVEEIHVLDGHGDGGNLRQEMIMADIIHGNILDLAMMGYDGLLLIGQHACAGTPNGFMSHSYGTDYALFVNQKPVGEIACISWLFGKYKTPVLMISGDDAACREAKALLPKVNVFAVKLSRTRLLTDCLSLEETYKGIEEMAYNSVINLNPRNIYKPDTHNVLEIYFLYESVAGLMSMIPGIQLKDKNSVTFSDDDYNQVYKIISLANLIASIGLTQSIVAEAYQIQEVSEFLQKKILEKIECWATKDTVFPLVYY